MSSTLKSAAYGALGLGATLFLIAIPYASVDGAETCRTQFDDEYSTPFGDTEHTHSAETPFCQADLD